MSDRIDNRAALEACIGKVPGPRDAKVIDHLDAGARRWLAASPLAFLAFADAAHEVGATLAGGRPGFAGAEDPKTLLMARSDLDDPSAARIGDGWGSLFLVPGLGETLRVNGRIARVGPEEIRIAVSECYMHCAKALIRADFWTGAAGTGAEEAGFEDGDDEGAAGNPPSTPQAWLGAALTSARFIALASSDAAGHADLSPKGDPAGDLLKRLPSGLAFADRPGNRRTDTWRNVLERPQVALLALTPGSHRVVSLRGRISLRTEAALREAFAVRDKLPALVACLDQVVTSVADSAALSRAALWPAKPAPADLKPADLFAAHVRAAKTRGLGGLMVKALVSVPGLMSRGLESDYKKNLY